MEARLDKLYRELRKTRTELMFQLANKNSSPLVKPLIEEELKDIHTAIEKLENGTFGRCEMSGELLPYDLLEIMPTMKTKSDCDLIHHFCRHS